MGRIPQSLKKRLRPLHDRLFKNHIYTVRHGFLAGFKRRGRMPWLQRPNPDPRYQAELSYFRSLDLTGQVVFDIGANLGTHSVFMANKTKPGGYVIAFEPDPVTADVLRDIGHLNHIDNLTVHQVALGSKSDRLNLVVPDSSQVKLSATLSTSLQGILREDLIRRRVEVEVARLDDYVEAHGLADPSFVKIDVEGFELEVLTGAQKLLERAHPKMFVEIHGTPAEKETVMRRILELFWSLDYAVKHFETDRDLAPPEEALPLGGHLIATFKGPRSGS